MLHYAAATPVCRNFLFIFIVNFSFHNAFLLQYFLPSGIWVKIRATVTKL